MSIVLNNYVDGCLCMELELIIYKIIRQRFIKLYLV